MTVNAARRTAPRVPQRLVSAAAELFAEQGYESTSVQQIVQRAGVTKGAMYHHFDAKDDLLFEIYHRMLAMQTERLERIADSELPVAARLRAASADVVVTTLANLHDAVVFFRSMHLLPPRRRAEVRAERRRYHERFRALVEEGQRDGGFRTDVSADIATHNFFGSVHHLNSWYRPGGKLSDHEIGDTFADLLLHALAPTQSPSAGATR